MDDKEFLGRGMKFPPAIDPGTGRFQMSSGAQDVRESLYIILMTQRGERWLRPEFGSEIISYTFLDISPTMLNLMGKDIRSLIMEQEPRITNLDVRLEPDQAKSCILVNINYSVIESNVQENLVFPFYLNGAAEEEEQYE